MAIGLGATPTYVRLTRGLVLTQGEAYVPRARAVGAGDFRLMRRHIRPNIASALLVQATVSIPGAIIAEAILSFLGLGVQPPTPSWGTMLNAAQQFLESAPWMAWWPGLAIFSLTLSFNLAGDGCVTGSTEGCLRPWRRVCLLGGAGGRERGCSQHAFRKERDEADLPTS